MIGGEHRKERYSERIEGAQNQPANRDYLPGTGVKSGGYGTATLIGDWQEERADAAYYDGKAVLPTENAKLWTTTYREATAPTERRARADGRLSAPPQESFNQATMREVVDRSRSSYPGHQPHLDPQRAETAAAAMTTTSRTAYVPPRSVTTKEWTAQARPVVGGVPGAQAAGVLHRLRLLLKAAMPNESAFPGCVMRGVRQALTASAGGGMKVTTSSATVAAPVEVNAKELQSGLELVGVETSAPECTAIIRVFDTTGSGTACVDTLARQLRGELTDRRLQIVRSVYALLSAIATSEAGAGEGQGGGDGLVRLPRVCELIDVDHLPRVLSGEVSAAAALAAFEEQWDVPPSPCAHTHGSLWGARGGTCAGTAAAPAAASGMLITEAMFVDYFSNASFEMESEGEFERMMRNVWHLSGGNGTCANRSCRRVRIVHLNGRASTVELLNDLAIKGSGTPEVHDRIRAALEKQGIKDIKSFTVL